MSDTATLTDSTGELEATFLPALGMILSSLRHRGDELLAQGRGPEAYATHGSTFAVPLLHPWANRLAGWSYDLLGRHVQVDPAHAHRDGATGLPIHGLLAASPYWQVLDSTSASVRAELDFGNHPEYLASFPFPHRLEYVAEAGTLQLTITLRVTPTSETSVPIAFGFHPYLTLPGSDRRGWTVRLPVAAQALLDEHQIPTGETRAVAPGELDGPLSERTFDDSFERLHGDCPVFSVADSRRRLEVSFTSGYPVAQAYAPPGSEFICFEPMTAPVNALASGSGLRFAEPGTEFTATFAITVHSL
jgi:galactose mutarotase-like enzyme